MDRYKYLSILLFGIIVGMACGDKIKEGAQGVDVIDSAHAQDGESDCETWEVRYENCQENNCAFDGWEPFGVNDVTVWLRRCAG